MLEVTSLSVHKMNGKPILASLDFKLERGEIMAVCGPSGCGKSTLLNAIAGFIELKDQTNSRGIPLVRDRWFRLDSERLVGKGRILIGSEDVSQTPPQDRQIGLVLQRYGYYPHLTGFANIAFPLTCRGEADERIREAVESAAKLVGLGADELSARAGTLSGGQAQRVAIAKMLAKNSPIALLDEPFAHLDQVRRTELVQLMRNLLDQGDVSGFQAAILVSHEWSEMGIADKIFLLNARHDGAPSARLLVRSADGNLRISWSSNTLELDDNEAMWIAGIKKAIS